MSDLFAQICRYAQTQPKKNALLGDTSSIPYDALPALIAKRISTLRLAGVTVAGLQMDNGTDWVLWDIALAIGGFICVPIPTFFTPGQVKHVQQSVGISHFITREGIRAVNNDVQAPIPAGTAKVTFTSGTTGTPKGVCLPLHKLEEVAQSLVSSIGANYADQHLSILPLSILLENISGVYSALLAGATCHLYSLASIGFANPFQPDFEKLALTLNEKKITSAILVPELLRGLMKIAGQKNFKFPSLKFVAVGGAKIAPEMVAQAQSMGLPVYEGYGLSECGSVVALNTPSHNKPAKVGRILPHIKYSIHKGEVIIHNAAFLGYVGSDSEGDFATGDLGDLDEDGYLAISGRSKNIIITSFGRNISPEWIESLLLTSPDVAQAFVYGDARPFPSALIVPSQKEANISAAINQINTGLPEYARIDKFDLVPPFTPQNGLLTATGRLRRGAIFKEYHALITQEKTHDFLRSSY